MGTSWKHLVMAVLLGGAAAWASAQQPASAPAANHAPVNPAVQTAQPFSNIVSENVFDLQKRDLAKEAQDQAARRATQPGNNAPVWREVNEALGLAAIPVIARTWSRPAPGRPASPPPTAEEQQRLDEELRRLG